MYRYYFCLYSDIIDIAMESINEMTNKEGSPLKEPLLDVLHVYETHVKSDTNDVYN